MAAAANRCRPISVRGRWRCTGNDTLVRRHVHCDRLSARVRGQQRGPAVGWRGRRSGCRERGLSACDRTGPARAAGAFAVPAATLRWECGRGRAGARRDQRAAAHRLGRGARSTRACGPSRRGLVACDERRRGGRGWGGQVRDAQARDRGRRPPRPGAERAQHAAAHRARLRRHRRARCVCSRSVRESLHQTRDGLHGARVHAAHADDARAPRRRAARRG